MAGLEEQVTQLQNNYEQKERKLMAERDEALQQSRWVAQEHKGYLPYYYVVTILTELLHCY